MSSAKPFTATDIQRYHNGGMTPAEMHSLEKASLEDPMLADALEGYTHTTTPSAGLQTIQNRLQQRLENDKKKSIDFINRQWLKMAALFVVIAGGGWLVLQTFRSEEDILATVSRESARKEAANAVDSVASVAQDSAPLQNETITAATSAQPATAAATSAAPSAPVTNVVKNRATGQQAGTANTEAAESKSSDAVAAPVAGITAVKDNTVVKGRIAAADTASNADVAQQNEAVTASEVSATKSTMQARARKQTAVLPEPVGGFVMFEKYIAANRKASADFKPSTGDVMLSFDIDKNGRPVNIAVTKSLCQACDAEAIRLLKDGPSWRANGSKGSVTITF